jgi:hypothetical protein
MKQHRRIPNGARIATKTNSGRPSRAKQNQGVVVRYSVGIGGSRDRYLVDFPAHPASGCDTDRVWIDADRVVAVGE